MTFLLEVVWKNLTACNNSRLQKLSLTTVEAKCLPQKQRKIPYFPPAGDLDSFSSPPTYQGSSLFLPLHLFIFLWPCSSSSKGFLTQWCSASQFYFLLIPCFGQGSLCLLSIRKFLLFLGHTIYKSRTWRWTQSFYLSEVSFKIHNPLVWAQLLVLLKKTSYLELWLSQAQFSRNIQSQHFFVSKCCKKSKSN